LETREPHDTARTGRKLWRQDGGGRDPFALAVAAAAIIMFVGTGSAVMPDIVRAFDGNGSGPDRVLVNALLLNIALIFFGWRHYRQMVGQIADSRQSEAQALALAESDPLTGFLNRRSFTPATQHLIDTAKAQGTCVAVIMIDLDNFKQINDFYGHAKGDEILVFCARRIADALGHDAVIARLGGDEFSAAVMFPPNRPEKVDDQVHRIVEMLAKPTEMDGNEFSVTASIGLVRSDLALQGPDDRCDPVSLLYLADMAMYAAKRSGKDRCCWFESGMENEIRFRNQIETGIRDGIARGEFVPYYEQQVDIATGQLTGFEMLTRWNSPRLGLVSPDIFIPVAEEIGVIGELSQGVIAQALRDASEWASNLTLSVNISPVQLRDPWFAQKLLKLLVSANFPAERLEIEVTERSLHENPGTVHTLINSLRNQGIRVSLDDFGTGYGALAQLRNLPFDRIKIDRSFISRLGSDENAAMVVEGISMLGKGLGLTITAEGIESAEVLASLRDHGNIKAQGYLYGKPEPADAVRDRLRDLDLLRKASRPDVGKTDEPNEDTGNTRRTGTDC
jgi:diguanylate cyclase (GGDEF)-like protein